MSGGDLGGRTQSLHFRPYLANLDLDVVHDALSESWRSSLLDWLRGLWCAGRRGAHHRGFIELKIDGVGHQENWLMAELVPGNLGREKGLSKERTLAHILLQVALVMTRLGGMPIKS